MHDQQLRRRGLQAEQRMIQSLDAVPPDEDWRVKGERMETAVQTQDAQRGGGTSELTRPLNRQAWKKFVHIAQPYFYPMVRGGGWMTLLLIVMLLVLVFVLLLLGVAAVTLDEHRLDPTLTEEVAPGLYLMLYTLLSSPSVLLVIA